MFIDPEALGAVAHLITREWGSSGYAVTEVHGGPCQSALVEVTAGDGGRFWVGSTRYGNTVSAEDKEEATRRLLERVKQDNTP